jgi:hypothetical protein
MKKPLFTGSERGFCFYPFYDAQSAHASLPPRSRSRIIMKERRKPFVVLCIILYRYLFLGDDGRKDTRIFITSKQQPRRGPRAGIRPEKRFRASELIRNIFMISALLFPFRGLDFSVLRRKFFSTEKKNSQY